jgi:hypothetical protein
LTDLKNKDFTYFKYEEILKAIKLSGYNVYSIIDWYNTKPEKGIVIRHDVDRWAINSLKIAELENKFGFKTTYYFRKTKGSFKPEIISEIAKMGHEIGYHYEDLSLANGNLEKTKELFNFHLSKLREIAEVKTCAMHGRPFSKYDNRDIWKSCQLEDFGLKAEAFLSIDYSNTFYFTDTGRSWAENSANLRDRVSTKMKASITTSDELIEFIKEKRATKIALVSHPERWGFDYSSIMKSNIMDGIVNQLKYIIKLVR